MRKKGSLVNFPRSHLDFKFLLCDISVVNTLSTKIKISMWSLSFLKYYNTSLDAPF